MDLNELQALMEEYLATLAAYEPDEYYMSEKRAHSIGLEGFMLWLMVKQEQKTLQDRLRKL